MTAICDVLAIILAYLVAICDVLAIILLAYLVVQLPLTCLVVWLILLRVDLIWALLP